MAIRWCHLVTLVATLTVIRCEQINSSRIQVDTSSSKVEDLCPCLPVDICPRIYGTKPEDVEYLGDLKKCDDDGAVRCCGASASFVVGKSKVTTEAPPEMNVAQPDISTTLNAVYENEIPDAEIESDSAEVSSANFHSKQRLNGEVDDEAAESESISKTANTGLRSERQQSRDEFESSTEIEESTTELKPTHKSHRKPKNLDLNVMTVYPNSMSGIPKTTPKNMPETNEMTMFDEEMGKDLHLVFSTKAATKPAIPVQDESNEKPLHKFAKRRRQYRPIQRLTTEAPLEDIESKPTTVSSSTVTRPSSRVRNFNSRQNHQEPSNSTKKPPRVRLSMRDPPTTQANSQDEEILHTSEDDRSHQNRFRLFNARHRLNYLRRSTTTATSTTSESPIETTTRQSSQSKTQDKRKPSRVSDSATNIPSSVRPSKMNETLVRVMDANHRNMISKVRVALKEASTENKITEIPRSFASVEMDNRIKKIETMLVNKMINVYTETKTKQRGDRPQTQETSNVRSNLQMSTTEIPKSVSPQTYRGRKKFQLSDLLDKTLIVPMSPNAARRMKVRSTTVKPVEEILEDIVVSTTRRTRRRPTTTSQPNILVQSLDEKNTNIRDSNLPENKEERNFRRRVTMRRRFTTVEPSSTTTTSPSIPTVSTKTISTPEATTVTQPTIDSTIVLNESEDDVQEELPIKLADKSQDETEGESEDIEVSATTNIPAIGDSDLLSDFKPSPLWSITTDEKTDFSDEQPNHSYDMDMDTLRNGHRRSRTTHTFESPTQYLNGFVPVTSFTRSLQIVGPIPKPNKLRDEAKVKYNLPRDSKAHFSKN